MENRATVAIPKKATRSLENLMIQFIKCIIFEIRIHLALNAILSTTNRFRQRDYANQMAFLIKKRADAGTTKTKRMVRL